jgi:hypothetical protein
MEMKWKLSSTVLHLLRWGNSRLYLKLNLDAESTDFADQDETNLRFSAWISIQKVSLACCGKSQVKILTTWVRYLLSGKYGYIPSCTPKR